MCPSETSLVNYTGTFALKKKKRGGGGAENNGWASEWTWIENVCSFFPGRVKWSKILNCNYDALWRPVLRTCFAGWDLPDFPPTHTLSLWFSHLLRNTGSWGDRKTNSISSYLVELPGTPTIFFASQNFLPPSSCVSWWSLITGENAPEWVWGFGNELQTVPTWWLNNMILALVLLWGLGESFWFAGTFVITPFEVQRNPNVLHLSYFHASGHSMSNLLPLNFCSLDINLHKFP